METSPCFSWIYIWSIILFGIVSTNDPDVVYRYVIHTDHVNFDKALEECAAGGFLTTLSTKQEESDILSRIAAELPPDTETKFNFWVGLRKARNECIVPHLTLKGFKWTVDSSEDSEVWQWNTEPQQTCTGIRCVLMSGEIGPSVRRWGLTPSSCKANYPFICKQQGTARDTGGEAHTTPETQTQPDVGVTHVVTPQPEQPLHPSKQGPVPDHPKPGPVLDHPKPGPVPDHPKPEPVPDHPKPGPVPDHELCRNPIIQGSRSLSPDSDDPKRMKVECWSGAIHWLTCSGTTQTWEVNGTSIENIGICQKCDVGYEMGDTGNCVDIDECRDASCQHDCINTEGSYKCICYDERGNYHLEGSAACMSPTNKPDLHGRPSESLPGPTDDSEVTIQDRSESGILLPVLLAVMALVVLIVVVAAVVKCCLMRRSKKRAMKKAEKMAMRNKDTASKDSTETTNEKEAI